MKRLVFGLMLLASPALAQQVGMFEGQWKSLQAQSWYDTPGKWVVPDVIYPAPNFCNPPPSASGWCAVLAAQVFHRDSSRLDCLRYENPHVTHEGRIIAGIVEETGMPGEPGWTWLFRTTEFFSGAFEWHVTTIDVCPKVG